MNKTTVLTGLRANNDLHIGNYLGALLPIVDMTHDKAGSYKVQLFVPDLHSFTTPIKHDKLQSAILENIRAYIALGLPIDHQDVYVYRQSHIPAHSELTWILSCFTSFGEMSRMTQFKEKSSDATAKDAGPDASVGLFSYPILMAADILLYNAEYVPVGDDQTQHLEFTRDIAQRMNNKFGVQLFTVPHSVKQQHKFFGKDQGLRIRDLVDPTKKMSKSDATGKGVIFLNDPVDVARKKIMSATTDSYGEVQYDYDTRPGISNLLDMFELFGGNTQDFIGQKQYGPLKSAVADKIVDFLHVHQTKLEQIDNQTITNLLERSERQLESIAAESLHRVQQAVGLRQR